MHSCEWACGYRIRLLLTPCNLWVTVAMPEIRRTSEFARWLDALADSRARAAILVRIDRLALGNAGDSKPVGGGVSELRIDVGPGYRVYFTRIATTVLLLIAGGDKSTQSADIRRAVDFVRTLRGRRAK